MGADDVFDAAVDALAAQVRTAAIERAWREVSDTYRTRRPTPADQRFSPEHALAYAIARAPATRAATRAVLEIVMDELPDWSPGTLLDIGAGLASSSWAATDLLASIEHVVLVDRAAEMLALGRRLAEASGSEVLEAARWERGEVAHVAGPTGDLVLASYVLSELPDDAVETATSSWWAATEGVLAIIDTGTPAGFQRVVQARDHLIAAGATILAPCPSTGPCPKREYDWCHFSVRLPRGEAHRRVKDASLSFEDEKYSYVVATRLPASRAAGRVVRHPQVRGGHVRVEICHDDRISQVVVGKSRKDLYRWARKAKWGDAAPADATI